VGLCGGLFLKSSEYAGLVRRAIRRHLPTSPVFVVEASGAKAAAALAGYRLNQSSVAPDNVTLHPSKKDHPGRSVCGSSVTLGNVTLHPSKKDQLGRSVGGSSVTLGNVTLHPSKKDHPGRSVGGSSVTLATAESIARSSTEQRNPRSHRLEKRSVQSLVDLFIDEEAYVQRALKSQRKELTKAATLISKSLQSGGRLFYFGAGTSGRLGVVDASEMPPTFNAPPEQVQAIIAGGQAAVFKSQEGAEDDAEAGAQAIIQRGIRRGDVVCGIAASGQTPFVHGALREAKKRRIQTVLLTCNPNRPQYDYIDVIIDLPTGPEIVTGSTRLKAGTATKVALNLLSTIAMIRLGRVQDNLMIDVQATNAKLKLRARRLVMTLLKCDEAKADELLKANRWSVRQVVSTAR
jgi:N-acetylmuramic acid 6-phosphate etherase